MNKKTKLFNNEIEMGLRILIILRYRYPHNMDKEMINYFSYFSLHSKDIGDKKSLHPDVPNRFGELYVQFSLIQSSISMLISKGLIKQINTKNGIEYQATEEVAPFLDNLTESYTVQLQQKVKWVYEKFANQSMDEIKSFVNKNKYKWGKEISFCTEGLLNE